MKNMNQTISNKLQNFFPEYPIEKAWLFGSYARGEETAKSDVDILVRFIESAEISLFDHIRIMQKLEKIIQKKVDLVEDGGIKNFAKDSVEKEKILIYERKTKEKEKLD